MERRTFLQALGAMSAASILPLTGKELEGPGRITLLHTNDTHSRIEPFPEGSGKNSGKGGIARRATLVKAIRKATPNVLLLDAGDVFQGTPYFNEYKGHLDYKLMTMCGYDAATLGNHDFDNGVEGLLSAMTEAKFPFVNCNYDMKGAPLLAARMQPYLVREFPGVKVGITGIGVDFKGLVSGRNHQGVEWNDPRQSLKPVIAKLRDVEKVDLVVCLSHLGYDLQGTGLDDLTLAEEVSGIDVIIGGHSHTFLEAPVKVANAGGETEIFQVGFAGINLGRMDFAVRGGVKVASAGMSVPILA
jgi:5'-nucleotidase